jgi:hypothetical protein
MANESNPDLTGGSPVNQQKVWTFEVLSGPPFQLSLPNNPSLTFEGHRTLWKLVGTRELAVAAEQIMKAIGVKVNCYTEEQTPEQAQERRNLLGV